MTVHEEDVARLMRGLTDEEAEAEFRRVENETRARVRPFPVKYAGPERRHAKRGTPWYVDAIIVGRIVVVVGLVGYAIVLLFVYGALQGWFDGWMK